VTGYLMAEESWKGGRRKIQSNQKKVHSIYFLRPVRRANQRDKHQGRLFSSLFLITSGLSLLFFDCLLMKFTLCN